MRPPTLAISQVAPQYFFPPAVINNSCYIGFSNFPRTHKDKITEILAFAGSHSPQLLGCHGVMKRERGRDKRASGAL